MNSSYYQNIINRLEKETADLQKKIADENKREIDKNKQIDSGLHVSRFYKHIFLFGFFKSRA